MMNVIALDDEQPALEVIAAFCGRTESVGLIKTFTRTGEARLYLENHPVDLLFLDINMPRESGLVFARSLPQHVLIIFTTAYNEFAAESYDVEAVDYLLKPFTFERFEKAMQRAHTRWQSLRQGTGDEPGNAEKTALYFRVDYGLVKVTLTEIFFIEGLDNYLKIHLAAGPPLVVRLTMKAMLDRLPPGHFVRVHRSFIISLDKIQAIRSRVILIGDEEIPIGSSYEKDFLSRFAP